MHRWLTAFIAAASIQAAAAAEAQSTYQPPRTANGRPDLQGVWATAFLTGLERPDDVKDLVLAPKEAEQLAARFLTYTPEVVDPDANFGTDFKLAVVRGGYRSSLLIEPADGKIPLSAHALTLTANYQKLNDNGFDNPEERPNIERCIIGWGQAPLRPEHGFVPNQIVQTPDAIVLMTEDVGGLRIVHMTGKPPPDAMRSYEGYSAGHWEGDTLVIETTHLRRDDPIREMVDRAIVAGPDSKIIERLTRVSETELLAQFTIEDPKLYARPWLAEFSLTLSNKPTYEYACHEANYALHNILRAGRLGKQPVAGQKR